MQSPAAFTHLDLVRLHEQALARPWHAGQAPALAALPADAPVCAVFSPHPDDEAISGALAWRLRHECGWRVVNVAVTLGSRPDRRAERWVEAQACCDHLGFELLAASGVPGTGLEGVRPEDAHSHSAAWQAAVAAAVGVLQCIQPRLLICPHELDGHDAHIGTSLLARQAVALSGLPRVDVMLSEYWNTQLRPQLAVGLQATDVATLMDALSLHVGEVSRHPYQRMLPAWFLDSARRGAERVGMPGSHALPFHMASLYGWQRWQAEQWQVMPSALWPPGVSEGSLKMGFGSPEVLPWMV